MGKVLLAAFGAAAVMVGAGQAQAALVRADFSGSYWVVGAPDGWAETKYGLTPHSAPGTYSYGFLEIQKSGGATEYVNFLQGGIGWTASFVFDTDLGVLTEHPFGSSGGTYETLTGSPIVEGTFTSGFPTSYDLTGRLLSISLGPAGLQFSLNGGGLTLLADLPAQQSPPPVRDNYNLADPLNLTHASYPYFTDLFVGTLYSDGVFSAQQGGVNFGRLSPVRAIPEPRSWALLLLGFGGLGAALRRRRRLGGLGVPS